MKTIIGTDKSGYATERNITHLDFPNYEIQRASNWYRLPNYLYFRMTGKAHPVWANLHRNLPGASTPLLHFFNGVSLSKTPWVSTYETFLPRWGSYGKTSLRRGLRAMAKPACKRLIALSDCAHRIQLDLLDQYPEYRAAILPKLTVLHPPQAPVVQDWSEKELPTDRIQMIMVGTLFFMKGGLQLLQALDTLLKEGAPLHLRIVSSMQTHDFATRYGKEGLVEARAIIDRHPAHISQVDRLPNAQVMELFKSSHLGVLPSWADTYGYSALEAQGAGCAVLTTNVRALPEFNPSTVAWRVDMPINALGQGLIQTAPQREAFAKQLREKLEVVLRDIVAHPELIEAKGRAALERVKKEHSPSSRVKTLEGIYDEILGKS